MAKKTNKGASTLKKINALAKKKYNAKGNRKSWVQCQRAAARELKKKK